MGYRRQIMSRVDYRNYPDYNPSDPMCFICYEVWEYDNYMGDHFFHHVYMNKTAAYKEVHRMEQWNRDNDGDSWNYWWILALTVKDHNKAMKEIGKDYQIITKKYVQEYLELTKQKRTTSCQTSENSTSV